MKTFLKGRGTSFCPCCQHKLLPSSINVIGVTGLIGSGKSKICDYFKGYEIINTDNVSKQLCNTNIDLINQIKKEFGNEIYKDNILDRSLLRKIVTEDENKLKKLNTIIHPYVIKYVENKIKEGNKLVIESALLFETPLHKLTDINIFVYCEEKQRMEHLIHRNTMSLDEAKKFKDATINQELKLIKSDLIINNSDTLENSYKQLDRIFKGR